MPFFRCAALKFICVATAMHHPDTYRDCLAQHKNSRPDSPEF